MRLTRLLPYVLLLAACGDNTPGAAPIHTVDAAKQIDAPMIDAPVQVGHNGRIWAIGNPAADNATTAFGFDDGVVTLPFSATTEPPLQIPGGTSVLQPNNGNPELVFDTNGDKIAFIADKTTAGTFDLYVANKDGSDATMLVPGSGVVIQSVQLSPDGTMAAYTSSTVVAAPFGAFDLFVVNTSGTPAPIKVSPDRATTGTATALNVLQFAWSSDSKLIAFSGDLHVDKANEVFLVDMTVATPTAVTVLDSTTIALGSGVSGGISFDANDNIYFSAKVTTAAALFQLFTADHTGANLTNPTFVPTRIADASAADVGIVGVTPDGKTLVFAADAPVALAQDLYAIDLTAATPTALKLTNITAIATLSLHPGGAVFTTPFWFSPDNKSVAEIANWNATIANGGKSRSEPFVTALDGSGTHRVVDLIDNCLSATMGPPANPPNACDVSTIQWTKDSASIYIHGDIAVNNDTAIFKADPTMTDQTPTPAFNVNNQAGDFFQMILR